MAQTGRELLSSQGEIKKNVIAVKVAGKVYDLQTPLPEGTTYDPDFKKTHPDADEALLEKEARVIEAHHTDGLAVIRHSTAHIMADAVQRLFPGTKVAFGPAIDSGFYYDYQKPGASFSEDDLRAIEEEMLKIVEASTPFERQVVTRDEAEKVLTDLGETFKLEHLGRLQDPISLYRHGDWVDLCEGPHVPTTGFLKAFKLTSVAGAYWRGDENNPMLQRIYGTAFANPKLLRKHLKQLEEAKKRDHRKLGKELDLVAFHPLAPASPFFKAKGAVVYNLLVDYVRDLYGDHGYEEVITPQIFDTELFHTSGHLPNYSEAMYLAATVENLEKASASLIKNPPADEAACTHTLRENIRFGIKPMNCPSHCLMYGTTLRSYRDLPIRMADFGRLHRFERSGVVQGMTRVRTFAQDDAHIFCTIDQMQDEIVGFLTLVGQVYEDFEFGDVRVVIATRPDKRMGTDEIWDKAEAALIEGVKTKGLDFEIAEGEGAFYGPKIELHLKDAIGRSWQMGTMQADFTLPERFDLTYVGEDNTKHRPVMLHRAMLGSVERFFGVLLEHVGGNFPTWLAPEQIRIVTVSEDQNAHAHSAAARLKAAGIRVTVDDKNERLGGKIREGRLMRVPYVAVAGKNEVDGDGLALRSRDENKDLGFMSMDDVLKKLKEEMLPPSKRAKNT